MNSSLKACLPFFPAGWTPRPPASSSTFHLHVGEVGASDGGTTSGIPHTMLGLLGGSGFRRFKIVPSLGLLYLGCYANITSSLRRVIRSLVLGHQAGQQEPGRACCVVSGHSWAPSGS